MHVKTSIDDNKIPIVCPMEDCKGEISPGAVKELVEDEYMKRYDLFSFKVAIRKAPNDAGQSRFVSCPTPDCEYVFYLDKDDRRDRYECAACKLEYCLE
jgi:hypothetical protein